MTKMGRPRTEIDWEEFDKLCGLQATREDIAAWFECSVDTIDRACEREKGMTFAAYFAMKRGRGKIGLRRKQYEVAMAGNVSMLIWLGKQYLEQAEKQQSEVNTNITHEYIEIVPNLDPPRNIDDDITDDNHDTAITR